MKNQTVDCIVYCKSPVKTYEGGILGDIDIHTYHFLVNDKGSILRETGQSQTIQTKMKAMLESQDIPVVSIKEIKNTLLLEVDPTKNPIYEQVSYRDNQAGLSWRTILYPYAKGTKTDCLGFSVPANRDSLGYDYTVGSVIATIEKAP
jgi:hypothetical protein